MTAELNTSSKNVLHLAHAADQFKARSVVAGIREFGNGNVHDTFLVTLASEGEERFILQRMNTRVFREPALVMRNMRIVTEHMRVRLGKSSQRSTRRWDVPCVLRSEDARDHWIDPGGSFWRAISFIESAESVDTVRDIDHGREVGIALGTFHDLISDLPVEHLADTLTGFHVTPSYLRHFDEVVAGRGLPQSPKGDYCMRFVNARRSFADVLEDAKTRGLLLSRPIHGDPKVNNVMIDPATRQAVSIIDLDTVKPGLIHYDIGDCLRSCCNPSGEESVAWEAVRFDPELCRAILQGYLSLAGAFLTRNDYEYVYDAIRLIAFELGLRFFTDYLEDNVYFKAGCPEHNLARAVVQFKLVESIESQEEAIRAIIQDLR
jgi:Ser/Thr protein kinase RdoA (MazF antagonist)